MFYDTDTVTLNLSVHELCTLAHRSGNLDTRFPVRKTEAMRRGSEIHRRLQSAAGPAYQKEVFLRNTTVYEGISFTVEGRADGVIEDETGVLVEEIKTGKSQRALPFLERDAYSQLRCYAYFLCASKNLHSIKMRMRIFDPDTGLIDDACSLMKREELREFYESLLARTLPFARYEVQRITENIPSVSEIGFPYPHPRAGQTELAQAAFRAIRRGQRLFAQAPTGIGKTMSVLYPAAKSIGARYCDRVFYLTAKESTRNEAYSAVGKLFAAGAKLHTIILYAKEQMCLCEGGCNADGVSRCNPESCAYARGYYDRLNGAIFELLSRQNGYRRNIVTEVAKKYRICPYELSLDLSEFCEIIICDYNYAFDPGVYLRRYFQPDEGECGKYVFLVDEAHNLPDRARDMYSARLCLKDFENVFAVMDPAVDAALVKATEDFLSVFRRLSALCTENSSREDGLESGYYINRAPLEKFTESVELYRRKLETFLFLHSDHPLSPALHETVRSLRRVSMLSEYYDDRFLTYLDLQLGQLCYQLICLDPAGVLRTCLGRARASVFFSATLTPPQYFADILGGGKEAVSLSVASPYNPSHLCVTAVTSVSTRYEDRPKSYKRIATLIAAAVSPRAGNYLVYFPSYDYLLKVLEQFRAKYPRLCCIVQQKQMSAADKESFLASFKEDEGVLRIGFCVLGGSFSEGVDLPGSRLIGAIVVGVGIPGLSNERNILRDYYENRCEQGYDYAYTFPGMNRVLQAAGRVIRREEDKGIVLLIDSRYGEEPYLHLYPSHWQGIVAAGDANAVARRIQLFWQNS